MSLFDRSRKNKNQAAISDYKRLSALGDSPDAWDGLKDEDLKRLVIMKCTEYGVIQDASQIPGLFALYRYAKTRLDTSQRMKLLLQFGAMVEEQMGQGHMGLMMFLAVDDDASICSTAAMSLAVLFDSHDGDELAGPTFVVRTLLSRETDLQSQGQALRGILLLGDKRLLPLLEDAGSRITDDSRQELARAKSGIVSEAMVEFWLRCLEDGCSESVFGSVVAAIAKLPVIAQVPFVLDVQRVMPAYRDSENPMQVLRKRSFGEYLEEIRPRLDALEKIETDPKLIPKIYEIWQNPEQFRGIIG